ncbi:MAG: hypothetical protein KME23_21225 [Goleter apudmare HA4340-LM2]|jgi:hypothetical protein|nr:hypothetical protein [Goleter apudmare HA4340-LM2]
METVYIVLIIALTIIVVVFVLRDRLTSLAIRGYNTLIELKAPHKRSINRRQQLPYSVNIDGNETWGITNLDIERESTNISGNKFNGQTDIQVSTPRYASNHNSSAKNINRASNSPQQDYLPQASEQPLADELITEHQSEPKQ